MTTWKRSQCLAKDTEKTSSPFSFGENVVPSAKRVEAELMDSPAPDTAEIVQGRKNFKSAKMFVGMPTSKNELGHGFEKKKIIPPNVSKQDCRSITGRRHLHKNFSFIMSNNFRYKLFVTGFAILGKSQ